MAITITSTAAAAAGPVRKVHAGVNAVSVNVTAAGQTLSASANATTFLLAKIPNGATIIGTYGGITSGGATAMAYDIGLSYNSSLTASVIASGGSKAADTLLHKGPVLVSCSDDAAVQYKTLALTCTPASNAATAVINLTVLYTFNNP